MPQYVLAIVKDSEKLRERCDETLISPETTKIVNDLKDTIRANNELVALAAPQLGIKKRIFCIRFADGDIRAFINPMITKTEGLHLTRERCASIPDKEYIVPRYDRILAMYQKTTGVPENNKFEGVVAEVFQQMDNLLNGILISDFGLEVIPEFDTATPEEQNEVIQWYVEQLKKSNDVIQDDIAHDELALRTQKQIEFLTKIATGELKVEKAEDIKDPDKVTFLVKGNKLYQTPGVKDEKTLTKEDFDNATLSDNDHYKGIAYKYDGRAKDKIKAVEYGI